MKNKNLTTSGKGKKEKTKPQLDTWTILWFTALVVTHHKLNLAGKGQPDKS